MKKKIISSVLLATMVIGTTSALAAEADLPMVIAPAPAADEVIVGVPQITVDGETVDLSKLNLSQYMYTEDENTLVPLRAVAEKMGYIVDWNDADQTVTVSSDEWEVVLTIGIDSYFGVTKIKDADGMTAPQSYGAAPKLIEDTTYVPAKMFELMGYKCNVIGQFADFLKVNSAVDETEQIPNPFVSYESIEDAKAVLDYIPAVPSYIPEGYVLDDISVMDNEMLQLICTDKNGSRILYRTAKGSEDISGDYNSYKNIETVKVNGCDVVLKGNDNLYHNASWADNDYSFSVSGDNGIEKEIMVKVVEGVK